MRAFGRWRLDALLGKSERTMAWRAFDAATGAECFVVLPREQPADVAALARWQAEIRRAARLDHPQLAPVVDHGVHDGWPWAAYAAAACAFAGDDDATPRDATQIAAEVLHGLAFAHDAGIVHHDVQPYLLLRAPVGDTGRHDVRVAGLGVAAELAGRGGDDLAGDDAARLQRRRAAAEDDVLAVGVLLHARLAPCADGDAPPDVDIGRSARRLPPRGADALRLPRSSPPLPDALRAIVDRATDRQPRLRYRNARTLRLALQGWLDSGTDDGAGPLARLVDRVRSAGALPSLPGAKDRVARLARLEQSRTDELADVVLEDPALAFEMLRLANSAPVRGVLLGGHAPVLTVRRAIAMIGLDGVRRAGQSLRPWPGALDADAAAELDALVRHCRRVAAAAVRLRPAGYDAELVRLLAWLQHLGRIVVQVHLADDARQIRRLMAPAPAARDGDADEAGLSEARACYAVLGVDFDTVAAAVARLWGLDAGVVHLMRRFPTGVAVRGVDNDDEVLRAVGSCAAEAVATLALPPARAGSALQHVAHRYGRALGVDVRSLQAALQPRAANADDDAATHATEATQATHAALPAAEEVR